MPYTTGGEMAFVLPDEGDSLKNGKPWNQKMIDIFDKLDAEITALKDNAIIASNEYESPGPTDLDLTYIEVPGSRLTVTPAHFDRDVVKLLYTADMQIAEELTSAGIFSHFTLYRENGGSPVVLGQTTLGIQNGTIKISLTLSFSSWGDGVTDEVYLEARNYTTWDAQLHATTRMDGGEEIVPVNASFYVSQRRKKTAP